MNLAINDLEKSHLSKGKNNILLHKFAKKKMDIRKGEILQVILQNRK